MATSTRQRTPPVNATVTRVKRLGETIWYGAAPAYRSENVENHPRDDGSSYLERIIELVIPSRLAGGAATPPPPEEGTEPPTDWADPPPPDQPPDPAPPPPPPATAPYAAAVIAQSPSLFWRLGFEGGVDVSGNGRKGYPRILPGLDPWEEDRSVINYYPGVIADGDGCARFVKGSPLAEVAGHDPYGTPFRSSGYYPVYPGAELTVMGFARRKDGNNDQTYLGGGLEFWSNATFNPSDPGALYFRIATAGPQKGQSPEWVSWPAALPVYPMADRWFHYALVIECGGDFRPYTPDWWMGSVELFINGVSRGKKTLSPPRYPFGAWYPARYPLWPANTEEWTPEEAWAWDAGHGWDGGGSTVPPAATKWIDDRMHSAPASESNPQPWALGVAPYPEGGWEPGGELVDPPASMYGFPVLDWWANSFGTRKPPFVVLDPESYTDQTWGNFQRGATGIPVGSGAPGWRGLSGDAAFLGYGSYQKTGDANYITPHRRRENAGDQPGHPTGAFFGFPIILGPDFEGDMDEFSIFPSLLEAEDVDAIYHAKDTEPPELLSIGGGVDVAIAANDLITFSKDGIPKTVKVTATEERNDFGYIRAWSTKYE